MPTDRSADHSKLSGRSSDLAEDDVVARLERIPPLPIHRRWATLVGLGVFLDGFTTLIVAAALTVLVPALHIDYANVGLLISASFFGMFFGAILFGAASEQFGRRGIFAFCVCLFGLLSIAAAFAQDFHALFWLRVVQGFGLGGAVPVGAALVAECLPARVRGRTFSFRYAMLFSLGYVLAPLAGLVCIALLGPSLGWRALFVLAGLALPFGIIAGRLLPESPRWLAAHGRADQARTLVEQLEEDARARKLDLPEPISTPPTVRSKTQLWEPFSATYRGRTLLVWTLFFTTFFVQYGLNSWLPTLYVKIGGLAPQHALALTFASGCVTLLAAVIFGLTIDTLGRKVWFIIGYGLALAGIAWAITALAIYHLTGWQALFSGAVLMSAGASINSGLIYLYAPELFPTRMRSWATSTGSAASRVGSIIAPMLIGTLLQAKFGLVSVFALMGIMCMGGLLAVVVAGIETKKRTLEEIAH